MDRVRIHPYMTALVLACAVLFVGAIFVEQRLLASPSTDLQTWGSLNAGEYSSTVPLPAPANPVATAKNDTASDVTIPYLPPKKPTPAARTPAGEFDFNTLIAQLSRPGSGMSTTSGSIDFGTIYALIPQSLISTSSVANNSRTPLQQQLYDYGNSVGSLILAYETQHSDGPQVLKAQAEDRQDPLKVSALRALAHDLGAIGENMAQMDTVPSKAQSAHAALAAAYRNAGDALAKIPSATGDQTFLAAITAYNNSVDKLTTNFISLVTVFTLNDVKFSPQDEGSVFMFAQGGL